MNGSAIALALAALATSTTVQTKQTKQTPCVAREDAAAAFVALAPPAIEAASERCRAFLPADAFLTSRGKALAERYRQEAGHPSKSIIALMRSIAGTDLPSDASADAMLLFLGEMLKPEVAKLKAGDCREVSDIVEALSPLPAANLQLLFGAIGTLALNSKSGKPSPFTICEG